MRVLPSIAMVASKFAEGVAVAQLQFVDFFVRSDIISLILNNCGFIIMLAFQNAGAMAVLRQACVP
ncbi:MAG TPA: hypothetical protein VK129_11680 [Terriglobales bacterium]|nr:hypothetical protein [Terriglobales bacterium]